MRLGPRWDCGRCRLDGPNGLLLHCRDSVIYDQLPEKIGTIQKAKCLIKIWGAIPRTSVELHWKIVVDWAQRLEWEWGGEVKWQTTGSWRSYLWTELRCSVKQSPTLCLLNVKETRLWAVNTITQIERSVSNCFIWREGLGLWIIGREKGKG